MKKTLLTLFQALVTLVILWLIFKDPQKRADMYRALQQSKANWPWLVAAFLAFGPVIACAIVRWGLLLRVQGIQLKLGQLWTLFMIGLFFNFLMPGGTGGDVAKIFYLLRSTSNRAGAVLATLVDRVMGLFTLILIATAMLVWKYQELFSSIDPKAQIVFYSFLFVLGGAIVMLASTVIVAAFDLVHRLPARIPGRKFMVDLAIGYKQYGRAWKVTLATVGLSIVIHGGSFLTYYCSARALGLLPNLVEFCAKMPIVNTMTALPLSVSGVGLREGLFVMFFPTLNGAALIGTCGFLATLAWGLIGGIVYLTHRPEHPISLAAMENVVELEEERIARTDDSFGEENK